MSTYKTIPINALVPSENNYRRSFDQGAFDELVASVKAKGVLQPILVRPRGKKFEIVAGHRRHKAALAAGLKEMPSIVKDLDDEEALEVQVIENTQREDPNPMDEAVGFKRLLEMGKHTPETLAEKIGHSTKYVLARTRLLGLIEEAQDLVATGELSLGHALVVSRLKNTDDQKKLIEMILDDGMTVKEAASRMSSFSRNLADAEFPLDGCAACTARTRNQADLFPALKEAKDECMDRECYLTKTLSHWSEWIEGYAAKGFPVFMDKEDMPAMSYGGRGNGVALIAPSPEGEGWNETCPPKYATKCVKCKTHHGFYLYVTGDGRYRSIERGEICLSSDCLDEMLKKEAGKGGEKGKDKDPEPSRMGKWEKERAAAECMKRFLSAEIFGKMLLRPDMAKRVEVVLLFNQVYFEDEEIDAFIKEFLPEYDRAADEHDICDYPNHAWEVFKAIPAHRLDEAKEVLFRKKIEDAHLPFLKAVAQAADIDLAADFTIDEKYLEEFEGQDLRELVVELWPDAVPLLLNNLLDACGDDETIKRLLLTQEDLKGRLPKELVEEAKETPDEEGDCAV